jgi:hypothetical protein
MTSILCRPHVCGIPSVFLINSACCEGIAHPRPTCLQIIVGPTNRSEMYGILRVMSHDVLTWSTHVVRVKGSATNVKLQESCTKWTLWVGDIISVGSMVFSLEFHVVWLECRWHVRLYKCLHQFSSGIVRISPILCSFWQIFIWLKSILVANGWSHTHHFMPMSKGSDLVLALECSDSGMHSWHPL